MAYLSGMALGIGAGMTMGWIASMMVMFFVMTPEVLVEKVVFFTRWARSKEPSGKRTDKLAREIIESIMLRPNEWVQENKYTFGHESGMSLWVANGVHHVRLQVEDGPRDDTDVKFSPSQKVYIWKAYLNHENIPDSDIDALSERLSSFRK